MPQLSKFYLKALDDPRIAPVHACLYGALFSLWEAQGYSGPLCIFSKDVMPLSKISGATDHKAIRDLHAYGYIKYIPSYNHFLGSLVYLIIYGWHLNDCYSHHSTNNFSQYGTKLSTPILLPYEPEIFWEKIRSIIREEIATLDNEKRPSAIEEVKGLTHKPLLKITEVCLFFGVSRPTIYDWIKHGKLRPYRVRRSLYFLWNDIQSLLQSL